MDAKTPNSAESTPAALSSGSRPTEELGANTGEFVSKSDLLAELGLPPDGQIQAPAVNDATAADDASTSDLTPTTAENDKDDGADEPAAETEAASAESEKETAVNDDAAPKTGEESDPPKEEEKAEKPKVSPELQQRFDELTFNAKTAAEEAARLREQLSALKAQTSGSLEAGTLALVEDFGALQAQRDRAMALHQWAIEHPDGGTLPGGQEGKEIELSREETTRIQAKTFQLLNRDVPARAAYLQTRNAADDAAIQSYPWLKNTTGGYGIGVQSAIEALPQLRQIPSYRLIAANAFVGEKLRQAGIKIDDALIARLKTEQAAKAPGKPGAGATRSAMIPPRAPASAAPAGSVPARLSPRAAEQKNARQRLESNRGDMDSIEASIVAKLR